MRILIALLCALALLAPTVARADEFDAGDLPPAYEAVIAAYAGTASIIIIEAATYPADSPDGSTSPDAGAGSTDPQAQP